MPSAVVQMSQDQKPKARRPRPNYNFIHRNLLPVEVYPLPVLIPHNPVSLAAIALSYLFQYLVPPRRQIYRGYFSSVTSSIHVTDPVTMRALWEMGFFGRGNLSRSEPTWLDTQQQKGATAEENTGKRRGERRQQKLVRAKVEQEEIAKQLSQESGSGNALGQTDGVHRHDVEHSIVQTVANSENDLSSQNGSATPVHQAPGFDEWRKHVLPTGLPTPPPTVTMSESDQAEGRPILKLQRSKSVRFSPTIEAREFDLSSPVIFPIKAPGASSLIEEVDESGVLPLVEDKEHLNLSLEEAFFLSYALGILEVCCENMDSVLPSSSLLSLFRRHSYHPSRSISASLEPDDPFMISYVVYHHYRSLGWVVRSGIKFSTDYLLYNRGPAFSHAEFAIVIVPSYTHRYWTDTPSRHRQVSDKSKRTWWWLHSVNRVQAQVHKHLVLCYVEIPPPSNTSVKGAEVDIGKELKRYQISDIGLRRWTPNRSRD